MISSLNLGGEKPSDTGSVLVPDGMQEHDFEVGAHGALGSAITNSAADPLRKC